MSTPELPDDLARWPADPYALLGVPRDVDPKELRRAYTRLIRVYKPEQYPDHFRRIREAFEFVSLFVGRPAPTLPTDLPRLAHTEPDADPVDDPFDAELRAAWETACAGDEQAGYDRLRRLHQQRPGHPDVCLRLYWLLTLLPELDRVRTPADWLLGGLRQSGLAGPLRELFRREVVDQPRAALGPGFTALYDAPAAPGLLVDLVDWRWEAADALGQLDDVMAHDLRALRGRLAWEGEQAWARLLVVALQRLAWSDDPQTTALQKTCRDELERLPHLQTQLGYDLDLLDYLAELVRGWAEVKRNLELPSELLRLIPRSWDRPVTTLRPLLLPLLARVVAEPTAALTLFGHIRFHGAVVLTQLGTVLTNYQYTLPSFEAGREPRPAPTEEVLRFVDLHNWRHPPWFRQELLTYCLTAAVAPEAVAEVVSCHAYYQVGQSPLAQVILNDWPLRYVCLAHRLFWAS